MEKQLRLVIVCLCLLCQGLAQTKVKNLLCENRINPLGLDEKIPRFSWQLTSGDRNIQQTAYEIRVLSGKGTIWNSSKQTVSQSLYIPYGGPDLKPASMYEWQVKIWDNKGKSSEWSEKAYWQTGFLSPSDFKAKWIESSSTADSVNGPALLFRKQFTAGKKIKSATAFITSHGMYEAFVNGKRIGNEFLTPGWTSYNKRLQYQVFDVGAQMVSGTNVLALDVASGWYRTPLAWLNNKNVWGTKLAVWVQLEIKYQDGTNETIISDGTWKSSDAGPVRFSELYDGETIDHRIEQTGWDKAGFDEKLWLSVNTKDYPVTNLIATTNEPIRKHEVFHPVRVFKTPKGEQVIDFGQNLVGWAQFTLQGKSGEKLVVDHAEVLDKLGNFYTENLRDAKARNTYILNGKGEEQFEPHFTFQGFRYIRVSGYSGEIKAGDVSAATLYSDMAPTGSFSCSDSLLNQLQHNIQWGQKGNFLDVPTDCPQRDERLGWTGDAQAFSRTAAYNMGVDNFFSKWLKDLAADQAADGRVPHVIPNVLQPADGGSAGWADASTIIPWNMWLVYGDRRILEHQYNSMTSWVAFMQSHSHDDLWNTGFHFGDWLFYRPADDNDGRSAVTDKYLIAQCFFAHSVQLVLNTAAVLNKTQDVEKYTLLLKKVKDAFIKEYVTASGRLVSSSQTAYVLALQFDMLPESLRASSARRLVTNIEDYDNHLTTGFLGTPYLCHVLTRFGYDSVAYKLLLQKSYPSWLYPVSMGATTIWERWDGEKPDSSFQTPGMNSFNHYAYGAIGDWMYRNIGGINLDENEVGYKKIIIQPRIGGNITFAQADLETAYGKLSVHWKKENGKLLLNLTIPANTTASVYIPAAATAEIQENGHAMTSDAGVKMSSQPNGYALVEIGSGDYQFSVTSKP